MLFSPRVYAQDAEMQLKLSRGKSEREVTINDIAGRPLNGVQESQSIALKWIKRQLGRTVDHETPLPRSPEKEHLTQERIYIRLQHSEDPIHSGLLL